MSGTWRLASVSRRESAAKCLCRGRTCLPILSSSWHSRRRRCSKPEIDYSSLFKQLVNVNLQSLTLLPVCADTFAVFTCNCRRVLIRSSGCIMQTSMKPEIFDIMSESSLESLLLIEFHRQIHPQPSASLPARKTLATSSYPSSRWILIRFCSPGCR